MEFDIEEIKKKAYEELYEDRFREAVDKEKEKMLLHKPFWHRIFPWKILVIRRD